ncbi:Bug family tripartite tricarboxylate transporter substrate binding protein [Dankookia sp. GCM10030260]|uniref:Bug family tripartite tricarboxylate transporter substrate binding protein n=1 Tax=Dankookia sp. GCM10030260 TaxID=3273390 RepID=UPI003610274C
MRWTRRGALGAGVALAAGGARAQEAWPNRPIRVIVPFPAGGTTDMLARLYAQRLTETLGQSVLVENRGGGGGSIGADVVAKAAPDGHTLLFHNLTFVTTTSVLQASNRAPHDIERDFIAVSVGAMVPSIVLTQASHPAQDLREFVAWAKGRTDVFYGSTGPGSGMNLTGETLKRETGIRMEHVPYRGAAPLVQELVAGRVQLGGDQISTGVIHVRAGTLKALATLAPRRARVLPEVPTVRELGFPALEQQGWNGYFAPAGTPRPVIDRLAREVAAAAAVPDIERRILDAGGEPGGGGPEDYAAMLREQITRIRAQVAAVGLRAE